MTNRERFPLSPQYKNLAGNVYGRWTVIGFSAKDKRGCAEWLCRCECGIERTVVGYRLVGGNSKSCGCSHKEVSAALMRVHGGAYDKEYKVWSGVVQRCTNPNQPGYKNYGARGISIAESWLRYENFISDMGKRPSAKHSIDRIDNDQGYGPGNCRWATKEEQLLNRRTTVLYELNGTKKTLIGWARDAGLSVGALRGRLARGWSMADAFTKPATNSRSY